MKFIFTIILTVSFLFSSDQIPAPEQDHPILIRGGWIHTVSNGVLKNGEILFDNGKIISAIQAERISRIKRQALRLDEDKNPTHSMITEINGFRTKS